MQKKHPLGKRIAIDIAGVGMIILAILLGWLPGPGFVPLFLGGLGLLSINHEWARNLRNYFIRRGSTIWRALFTDNPRIQWAYDILTIILIGGLYASIRMRDQWYGIAAITVVFFACVVIFFGNRQRAERLKKWAKKRRKH